MADVKLTAQDIARELMIDARRVMVEEFPGGAGTIVVRVARDGDARWRGWTQAYNAADLHPGTLAEMRAWVKS